MPTDKQLRNQVDRTLQRKAYEGYDAVLAGLQALAQDEPSDWVESYLARVEASRADFEHHWSDYEQALRTEDFDGAERALVALRKEGFRLGPHQADINALLVKMQEQILARDELSLQTLWQETDLCTQDGDFEAAERLFARSQKLRKRAQSEREWRDKREMFDAIRAAYETGLQALNESCRQLDAKAGASALFHVPEARRHLKTLAEQHPVAAPLLDNFDEQLYHTIAAHAPHGWDIVDEALSIHKAQAPALSPEALVASLNDDGQVASTEPDQPDVAPLGDAAPRPRRQRFVGFKARWSRMVAALTARANRIVDGLEPRMSGLAHIVARNRIRLRELIDRIGQRNGRRAQKEP